MTKLENGDASTLSSMHYVASASAADASDVSSPAVAALPEEDEGRSLQADTPLQVNVPFSSSFGFGGGVFFAVSVVAVVWGRLHFCGGRFGDRRSLSLGLRVAARGRCTPSSSQL